MNDLMHQESRVALDVPRTPAYVYSERLLREGARQAADVASGAGCGLLYALKACGVAPVLETLAPFLGGFAASSVFEARLASGVMRFGQSLHCYSPAYSPEDMAETLAMADYVSMNSLGQYEMASGLNDGGASVGLRINPEMSFVSDARYDPSRAGSKLGAPLSALMERGDLFSGIEGAHVHNNCESDDLSQLERTADALGGVLGRMDGLRWVNLGGGYYLDSESDAAPLERAVAWLRSEFGVNVFVEPGTGLVQSAGFLVSEVLDVWDGGGRDVAVLDTSTSHIPEVFEYEYAPEVTGAVETGGYPALLAGRTCLAGDLLGEHEFGERLRAGDRLALLNAGAYSHSRAAPFNGIPTPFVYMLGEDGRFRLAAGCEYRDFAARNGAAAVATT